MNITSEWSLLEKIHRKVSGHYKNESLIEGIGDDCAVFSINEATYGLLTTDIFIEYTHFKKAFSSPFQVGLKAMTANISDIASMGGYAAYAVVSLAIPRDIEEEYVLQIYDGLLAAANGPGVDIVGGDISLSKQINLNITLYGTVDKNAIIKRDGAQVGDTIYISGTLGKSKAGLEILYEETEEYPSLVEKHLSPLSRYNIVDVIHNEYSPTAMIDVSDGLLSDLGHICRQSNKGCKLNGDTFPIDRELQRYCSHKEKDFIDYFLTSGEEYELLFTSSILKEPAVFSDIPITPIGTIMDKGNILISDGREKPFEFVGFDHFK